MVTSKWLYSVLNSKDRTDLQFDLIMDSEVHFVGRAQNVFLSSIKRVLFVIL